MASDGAGSPGSPHRPGRALIGFGALAAALAVGLAAAGAHAFAARLALHDGAALFALAQNQHQLHAVGLIAIGLAARSMVAPRWFAAAGALHGFGLLAFCGSLYLKALTATPTLPALVPLGGMAFMAGWACLAIGVWRSRNR